MIDLDKPASAPTMAPANTGPQYLKFHATGGEYFRIWIVNLLLSIITLGIYSAWAKVRRNQYFYSSTELAGSSFEYHGNPVAILKGRIVAAVVVGLYLFAGNVSPVFAGVMALVMVAVMPWFIWRSLQFQLHNSAWRGIRFSFVGKLSGAYINCVLRPLLYIVTFGLAMPYIHQRLKAWQFNESRFGQARFSFGAGVGAFYKLYAVFVVLGLIVAGVFFWQVVASIPADELQRNAATGQPPGGMFAFAVMYVGLLAMVPLFVTLVQNLVWNHAGLEQHRFRSDVKWTRALFIIVTNYLAVICTLGLFLPFARVRLMRYRIESLALIVDGNLDQFVANADSGVGAAGEGVADFMDVDFSL